MTPQEELNDLRCYIKLTKEQAEKRDLLEGFLSNPNKCLYLDADSILYKVAHYGYQEGKQVAEMYEDYQSQVREIVNTIEEEHLYSCVYVVNRYRTRYLKALFDLTWTTVYKNKLP